MSPRQNAIKRAAKEVRDTVSCGYLRLSYGVTLTKDTAHQTPLLVECHNLQCGPMHGCDFIDKGKCNYRSLEVREEFLYKPDDSGD